MATLISVVDPMVSDVLAVECSAGATLRQEGF